MPKAKSKYKNKKTTVNGIKFDSKKEAERYAVLLQRLSSGEIRNLRLQVTYTLQESYITATGERVRAIKYVADFVYLTRVDGQWKTVVEDVKSKATRTATYVTKRKLMIHKYGITITEI